MFYLFNYGEVHYINAMGKEDHQYLNISVHQWNKTYFESQG